MKLDTRTRLRLRIQNVITIVLLIGIAISAAWLLERHSMTVDWTAGDRLSLSDSSSDLLDSLDGPLGITVFATENPEMRDQIRAVLERYTRGRPTISLEFIDPERAPELARREGIAVNGEIVIRYHGQREQLRLLSEREISNAIARLARGRDAWVVFMRGHGERKHDGEANFDLGTLNTELTRQGFKTQGLTLAVESLPLNTALLVIAGPQTNWLPIERQRVLEFLANGGNLLWLRDADAPAEHPDLEAALGLGFPRGIVADPSGQQYGLKDAAFSVVAQYPAAGAVRGFNQPTLFYRAIAISASEALDWVPVAILKTHPASWLEFSIDDKEVNFNEAEGDIPGPITIGMELTRVREEGEQRVIVIGDGDFLSNAFIGNAGNMSLGLNLFNWLTARDAMLNIRIKSAPDTALDLSDTARLLLSVLFLFVLPLGLLLSGLLIWRRRRSR